MTFLTPIEFAHILAHTVPPGRDLATLLAATGLRFGEAAALRPQDVDHAASTVTVTRAWKPPRDTGKKRKERVIGAPESRRSRRTIHVPKQALEILSSAADGKTADALLFTTHGRTDGRADWQALEGEPWTAERYLRRVWEPAVKAAQHPNEAGSDCSHQTLTKTPRIHDLRHTCASWMLGAGVPIAAVSRHLGHQSITTTVDRYGHLDPTIARQAADATGAALDSAMPL